MTLVLSLCTPSRHASAQERALTADDRTRLAEVFRLAAFVGDGLWSGWTRAPFAVLLVTANQEFLLRHPAPSVDFARISYDSLLATDVFVRPRTVSPALLATFPAVGGISTIVVGQPAATKRSSTAWVLTVLHEHFHQLQSSQPGYYAGVDALGLSRGDQSGMWMLTFPFAYDSATVQARFGAYAQALVRAITPARVSTGASEGASTSLSRDVRTARAKLTSVLSADDDRYLEFQLWQEGVARYTELKVARLAATRYAPSAAFRALPDYRAYASVAAQLEQQIRDELSTVLLGDAKRTAFYPAGAATALLLDRVRPSWRAEYFARPFVLSPLLH